jgi:tetratricopeptide (TPR) repeat protein
MDDCQQAIDLLSQAAAIARDTGSRQFEAIALGYLGQAWLASGDEAQAVTLLEQAVSVADITGDIEAAIVARSGLARAKLQLGDPTAALTAAAAWRDLPHPAEEPTMRLLEGLALLEMRQGHEIVQAFRGALTAADTLLILADSNVAALQTRALALSGLAVATGDPATTKDAAMAFARSQAATSPPGVASDTRRLLNQIARHDRSGILAEVRTAENP